MDTPQIRCEPPSYLVERINQLGGLNCYGKPNFRVIWGGNRTYIVGGEFKKPIYFRDNDGKMRSIVTTVIEMRELLKYHTGRWHLERWRGPEWYGSQEEWYTNSWDPILSLHTMGRYPHEGDYEHCFFLGQCTHLKNGEWCALCTVGMGEFIPLEPNFYMIERQIKALQRSEGVDSMAERDALFLREADKRQVLRGLVTERVKGAMRPTLATQPTSWQDGTRCSVPEAKWNDAASLPGSKGFRQSDELLSLTEE